MDNLKNFPSAEEVNSSLLDFYKNLSDISEDILFPTSRISIIPSLAVPQLKFTILLSIYILIILLASFGSILVIIVVLRANHLRTHSNCYLVNLAVSDLLLMLVACPTTIAQVSSSHWPLPSTPALCQLATFLPLLFSFASTFSICRIALDRHQLIVHAQNSKHNEAITIASILSVWIFAFIYALLQSYQIQGWRFIT